MNPFRFLTNCFVNVRPRPFVRHLFRPIVEALDERILPSTTAVMVKDINPPTSGVFSVPSSNPANLTNVNGTLFFTAADASHGVELWKSDGTDAGTVMVRDIRSGSAGSAPASLTVVGSTLFFTADDGTNGRELWKSDGTSAGTVLVKNIRAGAPDSGLANLTTVGSTLFFSADDGVSGTELWKSDGTSAGTMLVRDIQPGAASSTPVNLTAVGSTLFFTANDGSSSNVQLWKSNGAMMGTARVASAVLSSGTFAQLTAVGADLFFVFDPDGAANSQAAAIFRCGANGVDPVPIRQAAAGLNRFEDLTNIGGNLFYFLKPSSASNYALFEAQGHLNVRLSSNQFVTAPTGLTDVNGLTFFSAATRFGDTELWKFDGMAVSRVANINSGGNSNPSNLTNVNGTLYFSATDGASGTEIWQSDGTSSGTRMVRNINTIGSSSPASLTNVNGTLFCAANNGFAGTELWKTRANTAPSVNPFLINYGFREGTTMSVLTFAADADGDAVTFTATGLPAGMSINHVTGTISGTLAYSAGRATPYLVTVTGSDGFESTSATFPWTVLDVTPPTIVNPGAQGNNEGNVVSLAISARDPNGDVLTYSAAGLPAGLTINASTGVIAGTLAGQSAGAYVVTVTTSDGVNPVPMIFAWSVGDLTAPSITNPGTLHNNRGNTLCLTILASDPDADPLNFTALNLPPGLSIDRNTGRISGTISPGALASYDVTIQVSDGTNTSTIVFTWTIG